MRSGYRYGAIASLLILLPKSNPKELFIEEMAFPSVLYSGANLISQV